jgi:DNA-binding transcriptional LysR family regulator
LPYPRQAKPIVFQSAAWALRREGMAQNMDKFRSIDFNLLLVFDTIYRLGSVTRSAHHLGLTQGAVSHSLKRLRELFGDPLFIRGKDGLAATERGEELSQPISEMVARVQELLVTKVKFDPRNTARVVSLGLNAAAELAFLPTFMKQLRIDAPRCTVSSVSVDLPDTGRVLAEGSVDLVLGAALDVPGDMLQQKLYTHGFSVIVANNSELPPNISLQDYCAMDHISSQSSLVPRSVLTTFLREQGFERRVIVWVNNVLVIPYLVEQDPTLMATIPRFMTNYCLRSAAVRVVSVEGGLPNFDIFQIWHRRYDQDRFNLWLRSAIRSAFPRHGAFDIT